MKTWHFENLVAFIVLFIVAWFSPSLIHWSIPWLSSTAVFCAFCHNSIGERNAELVQKINITSVSCRKWQIVYWVTKEICFALVFILSGLYSLLVGNALFLLYPVWRKIWRKYHPLQVK